MALRNNLAPTIEPPPATVFIPGHKTYQLFEHLIEGHNFILHLIISHMQLKYIVLLASH